MKKSFIIFILLLGSQLKTKATHIVGGEMYYDYLGNNQYRITLKIYRDCINGQAEFDSNAYITVRDGDGNTVEGDWGTGVYVIGSPVITPILPTINSKCVQAPNTVCVEEGTYTYTITLPPKPGGYYITYQRCCRNNTISNILDPGAQGSTYYTKIPGPEEAAVNSSARFKKFPPIFLCNNVYFNFDHSATDPDGDQLIYSFYTPFNGLDGCCPILGSQPAQGGPNCFSPPPSCPQQAPPAPYQPLIFNAPYSASFQIASSPAITIDPSTGNLYGKPNQLGQYVVGICVSEYRGGKLINRLFRDFQFNIVSCIVSVASEIREQENLCQGNSIQFVNLSTSNQGPMSFKWDFGVPGIDSDTSLLANPVYTYQDTGRYTVKLIANYGKPCADTTKREFFVYPTLSVNFPPPGKQCLKDNSFDFNVTGAFINATTFEWDFSEKADPPSSTSVTSKGVVFSEAGVHTVKLAAKHFACRDSFADTVRIVGRPIAKIGYAGTGHCDPASIKFQNSSSGEEAMKYRWIFSNGVKSAVSEPVVKFEGQGVYSATLEAESMGFCPEVNIASIHHITINPSPVAQFSMDPREISVFDAHINVKNMAGEDVRQCMFTFGDGSPDYFFISGTHTYYEPGRYVITQAVTNFYGCTDTTSDIVRILPEFRFWIPNAFSPDGNELNDLYRPVVVGAMNYSFEIFDRWGERLFHTNNYKDGWNGNYKGKECKQDVYIWKISYRNVVSDEFESKAGHFTLLKNP